MAPSASAEHRAYVAGVSGGTVGVTHSLRGAPTSGGPTLIFRRARTRRRYADSHLPIAIERRSILEQSPDVVFAEILGGTFGVVFK